MSEPTSLQETWAAQARADPMMKCSSCGEWHTTLRSCAPQPVLMDLDRKLSNAAKADDALLQISLINEMFICPDHRYWHRKDLWLRKMALLMDVGEIYEAQLAMDYYKNNIMYR